MDDALFSSWCLEDGSRGIGDKGLFELPLTAFFASRQCPGPAICDGIDWAVAQARNKTPLIGGFQSPLECSVLEIVLAARSPVVIVLARGLDNARLPSLWRNALNEGNAAVVSMATARQRLSEAVAIRRNNWVAQHASNIVVAHVNPVGGLASLVGVWRSNGRSIEILDSRCT